MTLKVKVMSNRCERATLIPTPATNIGTAMNVGEFIVHDLSSIYRPTV